jgi:hypothetical protein
LIEAGAALRRGPLYHCQALVRVAICAAAETAQGRSCFLSGPLARRGKNSWKLKANPDTTATLTCAGVLHLASEFRLNQRREESLREH